MEATDLDFEDLGRAGSVVLNQHQHQLQVGRLNQRPDVKVENLLANSEKAARPGPYSCTAGTDRT